VTIVADARSEADTPDREDRIVAALAALLVAAYRRQLSEPSPKETMGPVALPGCADPIRRTGRNHESKTPSLNVRDRAATRRLA
jgi:hypothetical protein